MLNIFRSASWTAKLTTYEENCKFLSLLIICADIRPYKNIYNIIQFICSVKPTLKKVSKYENKFAKLQKKAAEFNFRNQLKVVKKKEFTLEEEDKEVRITFLYTFLIFYYNLMIINLKKKIIFEYTEKTRLVQKGRR